MGVVTQGQAILGLGGFVCEVAKISRTTNSSLRHKTQRLAGIHALRESDLFCTGFNGFGHLDQNSAALFTWRSTPGFKGFLRGFHGAVDIVAAATGNAG